VLEQGTTLETSTERVEDGETHERGPQYTRRAQIRRRSRKLVRCGLRARSGIRRGTRHDYVKYRQDRVDQDSWRAWPCLNGNFGL
jgi:hypothetical protein